MREHKGFGGQGVPCHLGRVDIGEAIVEVESASDPQHDPPLRRAHGDEARGAAHFPRPSGVEQRRLLEACLAQQLGGVVAVRHAVDVHPARQAADNTPARHPSDSRTPGEPHVDICLRTFCVCCGMGRAAHRLACMRTLEETVRIIPCAYP